jgi:Zn-dependent M28 family amino/carboxypeptidase
VAHHYHQPSDEWSASWDLRGAAIDLGLYEELGLQLANSRLWPGWKDGSEFKARRDASAGARL